MPKSCAAKWYRKIKMHMLADTLQCLAEVETQVRRVRRLYVCI